MVKPARAAGACRAAAFGEGGSERSSRINRTSPEPRHLSQVAGLFLHAYEHDGRSKLIRLHLRNPR